MTPTRLKAFILNRNTAEGIGFIVFSFIIIAGTNDVTREAALFPRAMALIIMTMGALLIWRGRTVVPVANGKESTGKLATLWRTILLAAVLLIFWIVQQVIGFYCASFCLFSFFYFFFDPRFSTSNIIRGLGFSTVITILFYGLFYNVMRIMTPTGILQ